MYTIGTHEYFDYFILLWIFGNIVTMAMRYARMSTQYELVLEGFNYAFSIIFNIELVIKLIGLGKYYFSSSWNTFDFFVVFCSDAGFIIDLVLDSQIKTAALVIRSFRILRILRLMKSFGRMILDTLVYIIPQIANIMSLIFLLLFIYSVLGINMFSPIMYRDNYNRLSNFRDFYMSIVLLMRWATGESWNLIMMDLTSSDSYNGVECVENQSYSDMQTQGILGWGSNISILYFLSFVIIITFVVLHLTVAAVIDGLNSARKDADALIRKEDIDCLLSLWAEYDPNATGWISVESLVFLFYELPQPLGLGKVIPIDQISTVNGYSTLKHMNLLQSRLFIKEPIKFEKLKDSDEIMIYDDESKRCWLIF